MTERSPQPPTPPAWPQQEEFKRLVNAYRKTHNIDQDQMAELLGMKPGSLRLHMYSKTKKAPGIRKLQQAAKILQAPLTTFVDDPGTEIAESLVAELTPNKRAAARKIMAVLSSSQITDAQAIMLGNMVRDMLDFKALDSDGPANTPSNVQPLKNQAAQSADE